MPPLHIYSTLLCAMSGTEGIPGEVPRPSRQVQLMDQGQRQRCVA